MKKLFLFLGLLLVVVVGLTLALPYLIPSELLKQQISKAVNNATGRELTISGDASVRLFPQLSVAFGDVALQNWSRSSDLPMLELERLEARLAVWPLLKGQAEIKAFVLQNPVVRLETDGDDNNWTFAAKPSTAPTQSIPDSTAPGKPPAALPLQDLSISDVRLVDGQVIYRDLAAGSSQQLDAVNLELNMVNLDSPFDLVGSLIWQGEAIKLDLQGQRLRNLLAQQALPVSIELTSSPIMFGLSGQLDPAQPGLSGDVRLNVPSIKQLADWLGSPLEASEATFNQLKLTGQTALSAKKIAFEQLQLTFDALQATGDLSVELPGEVPSINGQLQFGMLDLEPYLSDGDEAAASDTASEGADKPSTLGEPWPDEPIDMSALALINADLSVAAEGLKATGLTIGRSQLRVLLKNGRLAIDLSEIQLYQGVGQAAFSIHSKKSNQLSASANLTGIEAAPLLTDAADFSKLHGNGSMSFAVKGELTSVKRLMSTLSGQGDFVFKNGAVKGINLAEMARNLFGGNGAKQTDFAELSASYTIRNGQLTNQDLKMLNPFLRITGQGKANLPGKTVDYLLEPKAVASIKGQGAIGDESGILIPIRIKGPWDDLKFKPELDAATRQQLEAEADRAKQELQRKLDAEVEKIDEKVQKELSDKITPEMEKELKEKANKELQRGLNKLFGQ